MSGNLLHVPYFGLRTHSASVYDLSPTSFLTILCDCLGLAEVHNSFASVELMNKYRTMYNLSSFPDINIVSKGCVS